MNFIIGIDPDTQKNGIAIYSKTTKHLHSTALSFFDLFEYLKNNSENIVIVKIEAGWLVKKSNFRKTKIKNVSDAISRKVGENHAVGKKIVEMCDYLGIRYKLSRPLLKRWKGPDKKITHNEICKLLQPLGIEMPKRSNQDQRDSILICLY